MDMEKGFGIPPQTISRIQMTYTQRHNIELVPVPGRALHYDGTRTYAIASQGTGLNGSAPRLAVPPSEPSVIHLVTDNFYDNDVPHPSVTHNRAEEPPKRGQVLHE